MKIKVSPLDYNNDNSGESTRLRLSAMCELSLLLVFVPAPRGYSPSTPVFPSPQKPTFLNSNSIWNLRATGLLVVKTVKCHPR